MDGLRETLRRTGGIQAVAAELDQSPAIVAAAFESLVPVIVSALHLHSAAAGGGVEGCRAVIALLEREGGGALAVDVMHPGPSNLQAGETLLAKLIGDRPAQAQVVDATAGAAGLETGLVAQILPRLAMLVGGYVAARARERPDSCRLDDIVGAQGEESALTAILANGNNAR